MSTNPVKVPDIRFSSSQFRKQHLRHKKVVSRTSLAEAIYAWPFESISRGRANSHHSRPYQGIWGLTILYIYLMYTSIQTSCFKLHLSDFSRCCRVAV
ncbi:unnamed protein product [Schistosoma curassoni]|uniref:Transposase n=1 Tax=Schistosoma curassoni TaxID=6186 RepID=A0A183KJ10_9TREM|nr:unnamed protein product [Schistosoma curassoni]